MMIQIFKNRFSEYKKEYKKFLPVLVIAIFSVVIFITTCFMGYTPVINNIYAVSVIILSGYLCYIYRHNVGMLLVMLMILYTNYSISVGVYLDPAIRPDFLYYQFTNPNTYGAGIVCCFIFELVLLLCSLDLIKEPHLLDRNSPKFIEPIKDNMLIAYGAVIVYLIMFFSGFRMGVGTDGRASITALSEYKVIVQLIGIYYAGKRTQFYYIWTAMVGLTSILTFIGGNRVDAMSNVIVLIVLLFADFIDYKKIIIALPFGVVLLAAVGFLRANFNLSLEALAMTINALMEDKFTYEGAIFGYLPSLSIVELSENVPWSEKWSILVDHIAYIFKIGFAGDGRPDLSSYSRDYYTHYWGFVSPTYFYFWFKYIGAILLALLVKLYIYFYKKSVTKSISKYTEHLVYILSIYFMCNVARWYCYGPMGLLRGVYICFLAYTIVYVFDKFIQPKITDKFLSKLKGRKI